MSSKRAFIKGNAHIVPIPHWTGLIRIARLVIALAVLGSTAAATAAWGHRAAFAFSIFTGSAALVISAYYLVASETKPVFYNRWVVLGLEVFSVVSWLASFTLLAQWSVAHDGRESWNGPFHTLGWEEEPSLFRHSPAMFRRMNKYHVGQRSASVAAGLGALEFVLSAGILAAFSLGLRKHRAAGHHSVYGSSTDPSGEDEEK